MRWYKRGLSFFLLVWLLLPPLLRAQTKAQLTCRFAATQIAVNEETELIIEIKNVTDLHALFLTMSFDPQKVSLPDGDPGIVGNQISQYGNFLELGEVSSDLDNVEGIIDVTIEQPDDKDARSGSGELGRTRVRGLANGTALFTFEEDETTLYQKDNLLIEYDVQDCSLRVGTDNNGSATPTVTSTVNTTTTATPTVEGTASPTVTPDTSATTSPTATREATASPTPRAEPTETRSPTAPPSPTTPPSPTRTERAQPTTPPSPSPPLLDDSPAPGVTVPIPTPGAPDWEPYVPAGQEDEAGRVEPTIAPVPVTEIERALFLSSQQEEPGAGGTETRPGLIDRLAIPLTGLFLLLSLGALGAAAWHLYHYSRR